MRLLNTSTLELEEFFGRTPPKYAILSHTWGLQEISYEDVLRKKENERLQANLKNLENTQALMLRNLMVYEEEVREKPPNQSPSNRLPSLTQFARLTMNDIFEASEDDPKSHFAHHFASRLAQDIKALLTDSGTSGDVFSAAGWAKIVAICTIAKSSGYDYVWIDTCCIQKTSSAELSEAINSMFAYYQEAAVCFAYLSDVRFKNPIDTESFCNSRWFKRGWTLQELLAPSNVIFFADDWQVLGSKAESSLGNLVSKATNIPVKLLNNRDEIWSTSISNRMSWAARRETTRIEDRAYSLLGLFGVNMPLLYGERERAFVRLQEEIIRVSDDQTILGWTTHEVREGVLAASPKDYAEAQYLLPIPSVSDSYIMTQRGLHIEMGLIPTEAYHSGKLIHVGLLDCQSKLDFSKQTVIYVCETCSANVYARCSYRGKYTGHIDFKKTENVEKKWIYLQSSTKAIPRLRSVIYLQLGPSKTVSTKFFFRQAQVKGVNITIRYKTNTARIERTRDAWSHDVAAGLIFHDEKTHVGFIVVLYFPQQKTTGTELGGIQVFEKPSDWWYNDWLQRSSDDVFAAHIQESALQATSETTLRSLGIHLRLVEKSLLNQQVYVLELEDRPFDNLKLRSGFPSRTTDSPPQDRSRSLRQAESGASPANDNPDYPKPRYYSSQSVDARSSNSSSQVNQENQGRAGLIKNLNAASVKNAIFGERPESDDGVRPKDARS